MQAISISNINTKPHEPSLADFMSQLEMLTSSTSFEDFGILGTFDLIINRYEDNFKLQDLSKSKQMSLCLNSLSRISPFTLPNFRFKKKKQQNPVFASEPPWQDSKVNKRAFAAIFNRSAPMYEAEPRRVATSSFSLKKMGSSWVPITGGKVAPCKRLENDFATLNSLKKIRFTSSKDIF